MAKNGNIVDLKHNWSKEQLVQKANYNWKSLRDRIQELENDIKSGKVIANKAKSGGSGVASSVTNNYTENVTEIHETSNDEVMALLDEKDAALDELNNEKLPALEEALATSEAKLAKDILDGKTDITNKITAGEIIAGKINSGALTTHQGYIQSLVAQEAFVNTLVNNTTIADKIAANLITVGSASGLHIKFENGGMTVYNGATKIVAFSNIGMYGIMKDGFAAERQVSVTHNETQTIEFYWNSFYDSSGNSIPKTFRPYIPMKISLGNLRMKIQKFDVNPSAAENPYSAPVCTVTYTTNGASADTTANIGVQVGFIRYDYGA